MKKHKIEIDISCFPIIFIMMFAFLIRFAILIQYNVDYNIASDDVSYVNSAIALVETGQLTMHGVLSAQIMPGMPFLIAPIVLLFGKGSMMWLMIKLLWMFMGLSSIYGVYRIGRLFSNRYFGALAAFFFLAIDFAWMDSLVLTETPFMFSFIYLLYFSLLLGKTKEKKYYWWIIVSYIFCLMIRPTIAPFPVFLFIYLYFCKYDLKLMGKQILIAGAIVACFIVPWTIRNYIHFDAFVPLTYGMGDPKLMGTYQGDNAPLDEDLDYQTNVIDKMPEKMKPYYLGDGEWTSDYMSKYYSLELSGIKADYRMQYWWEHDKPGMLRAYLLSKPYMMVYGSFYWVEVFNIPVTVNYYFRNLDIMLFVFALIGLLCRRKHIKEMVLLGSFYFFQVMVYSYSFAFNRYAQTLFFIRFIIIAWGIYTIFQWLSKKFSNNKVFAYLVREEL